MCMISALQMAVPELPQTLIQPPSNAGVLRDRSVQTDKSEGTTGRRRRNAQEVEIFKAAARKACQC